MNQTVTVENQPKSGEAREKVAQYLWTSVIVGFFVIQAIIWMVAIALTSNDPSHAVISDFDAKALNWDEHKQQLFESQALGWTFDLQFESQADAFGNRVVKLIVHDATGEPIDGATVKASLFHRARAARVQDLKFNSTSVGTYSTTARIQRQGYWQFDATLEKGGSKFIISTSKRFSAEGR